MLGVRKMARLMVQKLGYTVLEAESRPDGLRVAKGHGGKIDLLITDVVMQGMGGVELARQMATVRPGIPTLYMSGYVDNLVLEHGVSTAQVPFLQKPFSRDQLGEKVRSVLEGMRSVGNTE